MRANLDRTKAIGYDVRALLERGEVEQFGELMHEHWENKLRRSPGMATERIDHLYTLARRSGVIGGKVVGAGGGGFLLVYARRPDDTRQAMAAAKRRSSGSTSSSRAATASSTRDRAGAGAASAPRRHRRLRAGGAQARCGARP